MPDSNHFPLEFRNIAMRVADIRIEQGKNQGKIMMLTKQTKTIVVATMAAGLIDVSQLKAAITINYNNSAVPDSASIGGALVTSTPAQYYSFTDVHEGLTFSGYLTVAVYASDPLNPYVTPSNPNALTFVYTIDPDPSLHGIVAAGISLWKGDPGDQTAISYDGVKPVTVHWADDSIYVYLPLLGLNSGSPSTLFVYSKRDKWIDNTVSIIGTGVVYKEGYAQILVPEPSTCFAGLGALLLFGLSALPRRK